MLHQPAPGFHQPLLETGERPALDPRRQNESAPEVAQVVRQNAQLQAHLVRLEPMARQARPVRRLLAFFDPLLRRAAFVVEPDDRRLGRVMFVTMKPTRGNSSPRWCSTLATIRLGVVQLFA